MARSCVPGKLAAGRRNCLGRRAEPLVELRRGGLRPNLEVDLEEALQAPGLEVARPREQLLTVAHERLGVQHRRVVEDANPGLQERSVVELLRSSAGPVVRIRRDEEPNPNAAPCGILDPSDHSAIGDVRVDDIQRLGGGLEQARDRGGDRPEPTWGVVQDDRRNRVSALIQLREQGVDLSDANPAAEPAEAGQEDELELCDHRAGDTDEQVVEATVLEVVLDSGAADPTYAAVDDYELAMVDMPEAA